MPRPPRPWLFAIASLPYGVFNGLIALALPYLMRRHGAPVERIAATIALVQAPSIWYFLWAPVVDMRFRRRTWVLILAVASGICLAVALTLEMATAFRAATILLVAGSVINQPISSALGGLVASVTPAAFRGRTAGWGQAGNLGGGVLAGALALWLSSRWPAVLLALLIGLLVIVPAVSVLAVDEPPPAETRIGERLSGMWRELRATFRRRSVWLAFLFFLSPAGAGALMNLFSAVAVDYRASTNVVIWIVGVGGGALTAVGALVGGWMCDRFDRWKIYPVTGLLSATAALGMLAASLTPATYIAGAAAYSFVTGFGYAAFMALALELLSDSAAASSTRFTLFIAATNVPLVYMIWLDGMGHARWGVRGMLAVDALANGLFGVSLLVALAAARARVRQESSVRQVASA